MTREGQEGQVVLDSVFAANDWVTNRLSVERSLKIKIREIANDFDNSAQCSVWCL